MEETKVTRDTKEEILITALHRFARDGYEAVSVSQIASDLGITKGALYRHYKNKRDIFDHIVARMEQGDSDQAESHDMPEGDKESMPEKYEEVSLDDFAQYSRSMFEYWTEDDFASSFRKTACDRAVSQCGDAGSVSAVSCGGACRLCKGPVQEHGNQRSEEKSGTVLCDHVPVL